MQPHPQLSIRSGSLRCVCLRIGYTSHQATLLRLHAAEGPYLCCSTLDSVIKKANLSFIVLYSIQAYMVTNGVQINTDNLDQGPVLSYNTNPTLMLFRFRGRNHRSSTEALRILFFTRSIMITEVLRRSDYSRSPSSKALRKPMSTGTNH